MANIATAKTSDLSESASAYVVVTKEGLLISKVATPKTFYAPGQVIEYDIVVENNGSSSLENILVSDDLTNINWTVTLGPGDSRILKTSYVITASDMLVGAVENTAAAVVNQSRVDVTELVFQIDPPKPVPLASWAILLGGMLIAGFVFYQYRRSMRNRTQHADVSGE